MITMKQMNTPTETVFELEGDGVVFVLTVDSGNLPDVSEHSFPFVATSPTFPNMNEQITVEIESMATIFNYLLTLAKKKTEQP